MISAESLTVARVGRAALIALPWSLLAVLGAAYLGGLGPFEPVAAPAPDPDSDPDPDSWVQFEADLAYEGCVTKDRVIATVEAHGWTYTSVNMAHVCMSPGGLDGWISVEDVPEPQTPVGPNSRLFGFDEDGCVARWRSRESDGESCEALE